MTDSQFIGIYVALSLIMLILEIGLISICAHLRDIKEELKRRSDDDN